VKIEVKQEHLTKGERADCQNCPVALALNEATSCYWSVDGISARNCHTDMYYSLPIEVRTKIGLFDSNVLVKPFSFEFDYEEPYLLPVYPK
jgi:hypothetical protein